MSHGTNVSEGKSGPGGLAAATAALVLSLVLGGLFLPSPARAEIVVKLEITADKAAIYLEPDGRSPVVETLARGAVVTLSSAMKFRTNWFYVLFVSSRSGRTLAGYVMDGLVRKLTSTLRVITLSPSEEDEIADPKELDLASARLPELEWGMMKASVLRAEGRPLTQEVSGGLEFLRYHRDLMGKKCLVAYVLNDQRLVAVRLYLLERYADKNRYVADYNKIRDFLNAKVGEPRYDNVIWRDRDYAERGENWGTALSTGCLSLCSEWLFHGTGLRLSLTGEKSEILFAAEANDTKAKNPASF